VTDVLLSPRCAVSRKRASGNSGGEKTKDEAIVRANGKHRKTEKEKSQKLKATQRVETDPEREDSEEFAGTASRKTKQTKNAACVFLLASLGGRGRRAPLSFFFFFAHTAGDVFPLRNWRAPRTDTHRTTAASATRRRLTHFGVHPVPLDRVHGRYHGFVLFVVVVICLLVEPNVAASTPNRQLRRRTRWRSPLAPPEWCTDCAEQQTRAGQ
jgi:hypothetical protein